MESTTQPGVVGSRSKREFHNKRVAKMGYTQRVTKRDKNGRVTSSFLRVRIVVPDGLSSFLPAPYTGNKNLTKKTSDDRETAEWTARFLAMIDQAAGRTTAYKELVGLDSLSVDDLIRRSPAVLRIRRQVVASYDFPMLILTALKRLLDRRVCPNTRPQHRPKWDGPPIFLPSPIHCDRLGASR
jgi:hypothetical protein